MAIGAFFIYPYSAYHLSDMTDLNVLVCRERWKNYTVVLNSEKMGGSTDVMARRTVLQHLLDHSQPNCFRH